MYFTIFVNKLWNCTLVSTILFLAGSRTPKTCKNGWTRLHPQSPLTSATVNSLAFFPKFTKAHFPWIANASYFREKGRSNLGVGNMFSPRVILRVPSIEFFPERNSLTARNPAVRGRTCRSSIWPDLAHFLPRRRRSPPQPSWRDTFKLCSDFHDHTLLECSHCPPPHWRASSWRWQVCSGPGRQIFDQFNHVALVYQQHGAVIFASLLHYVKEAKDPQISESWKRWCHGKAYNSK